MKKNRLCVEGIYFTYSKSNWVLKEITQCFEGGKIYVVIGPNGSGKTTLLKILGLLYKPQKGRVIYNNYEPWTEDDLLLKTRRRIVYVHEKPILLRGSVIDNLRYPLQLRGINGKETENIIMRVSDELGLNDILYYPSKNLSAGQAQLVSVGRALTVDPDVLLLDEPFSHLDSEKRKRLSQVLRNLRAIGKTIVIATHDTYLASKIGDRFLLLENGKTSEIHSLDEVFGV